MQSACHTTLLAPMVEVSQPSGIALVCLAISSPVTT